MIQDYYITILGLLNKHNNGIPNTELAHIIADEMRFLVENETKHLYK